MKWFQRAMAESRHGLSGWHPRQSALVRRQHALRSRPENWKMHNRYISAGRALLALANVTKDQKTYTMARRDSHYFFNMAKRHKR